MICCRSRQVDDRRENRSRLAVLLDEEMKVKMRGTSSPVEAATSGK
jgi:hypothetical protein